MIKKILFNRGKMLSVLIGVSILMFFSLFVSNAKIAGIGLTLWVATVFWNVYLILNTNNMNFGSVASEINKKYEKAKYNKKYGEQFLYGITVPMIGVGLLMIVQILILFFTVL